MTISDAILMLAMLRGGLFIEHAMPTCGGVAQVEHAHMLRAERAGKSYAVVCADGHAWFRHGWAVDYAKIRKQIMRATHAEPKTVVTNAYWMMLTKPRGGEE